MIIVRGLGLFVALKNFSINEGQTKSQGWDAFLQKITEERITDGRIERIPTIGLCDRNVNGIGLSCLKCLLSPPPPHY